MMGNMTIFIGFLGMISSLGLLAAYMSTKWDD
ncbi:protein MgtS [Serratia entomophila]|uniref:Protein MgtS n=1 Tax=Serratia entomophila TaxID=42906 RepID=A0ABY5D131_9GAMM|nr:protein MgtS [Serratia entomophila]USV03276.1 protein MgtS [Serratia entomophila]